MSDRRDRRFIAPASDRLDRLVAAELPELSRSQARRLIEDGQVTVDAEIAGKAGTAEAKQLALKNAGATISESPSDIGKTMEQVLKDHGLT